MRDELAQQRRAYPAAARVRKDADLDGEAVADVRAVGEPAADDLPVELGDEEAPLRPVGQLRTEEL